MLEDDADRLERFSAVLRRIAPALQIRVWRDANAMIGDVGALLSDATLISLDHDLVPERGAPDPGDGLAIARYLASLPIIRPVIIHSSNSGRSRWMAGEFDLAGWRHWRVAPIGDDWIEHDWRMTVQEILQLNAASPHADRSNDSIGPTTGTA